MKFNRKGNSTKAVTISEIQFLNVTKKWNIGEIWAENFTLTARAQRHFLTTYGLHPFWRSGLEAKNWKLN